MVRFHTDLLRIKDIQDIFLISKPTAYRWIKSGKLNVLRIGSIIRVESEEVERLKRSLREKGGEI